MAFRVVLAPLFVFVATATLHVILWRVARPRRTLRTLFFIFYLTACLAALAGWLFGYGPRTILEGIYAGALYGVLSLSYLINYTGIEGQSPSALIVTAAAAAGRRGITRADIETLVTDDVFIAPRLSELMTSRHVLLNEQGRLRLTSRGHRLIAFFAAPRRFMKIHERGG